ncbi:MAG TPA: universal stress protein [Candidatus Anammoximicrobium sp.]|nr:universal stress protein [Candidatus Anammoximicrobium sp.]
MTVAEEQETRRIVVAVDASPCGRAALETATQWAAQVRAELQTLFVEDADLWRWASLPFANEVPLSYAVPRPLGVTGLECAFRAHAEQVRRALAEAADRLQVRWSFQVQRGDLVRTCRALAGQAALLIVGMAETAGTASRERRAAAGSILVIDEGSSSSDGVLRIAAELAETNLGDLVVLSPASENGAGPARRREIDQCLDGCHVGYTVQPLPALDARTIVRLAERMRKRLILLVLHSELLDEADLEILVRQLACPLALVP